MIVGVVAADTSSVQRFLAGFREPDALTVAEAFYAHTLRLPPPVLTELLSDERMSLSNVERVRTIPLLKVKDGYWDRAGLTRRWLLSQGLRAMLPDSLIAQSCIDHDLPLITYDRDFRHFLRAGLKLIQQES